MCDWVRMLDEDAQMVFVRLGFRSGGFCRRFDEYEGAFDVLGAWKVEECVLRE